MNWSSQGKVRFSLSASILGGLKSLGVISDIENGRHSYYVNVGGQEAMMRVIPATVHHKKHLKTGADTTLRNNLDCLPTYKLPKLFLEGRSHRCSDPRGHAWNQGRDFSESENDGKLGVRPYSGRDVPAALGIADEIKGEDYVALLGACEAGRFDKR